MRLKKKYVNIFVLLLEAVGAIEKKRQLLFIYRYYVRKGNLEIAYKMFWFASVCKCDITQGNDRLVWRCSDLCCSEICSIKYLYLYMILRGFIMLLRVSDIMSLQAIYVEPLYVHHYPEPHACYYAPSFVVIYVRSYPPLAKFLSIDDNSHHTGLLAKLVNHLSI